MRGVILAAGRGARLNGGNSTMPKCLVTLGGETLLARNIRLLRSAGLKEIVVVVGCAADTVRQSCRQVTFVENTRFAQTNSMYSLWMARHLLLDGFVVMNCDVLAHPQLLDDLVTARHEDALLVDYADDGNVYGDEEMKVRIRRGRVVEMSKTMSPDDADAENLGIVKFGSTGAQLLVEEMDRLITAGDLMAWVPRAFTGFAARRPLHAIGTRGYPWLEIDFPDDYRRAVDDVLPRIERDLLAPRIARSA
jgi:L-glutamine-phosphate cytidylyltransferase